MVTAPLVFIDGDDEAQLAWALKRFDTKARLIMVKGAPLEAMTRHQRRFYFDQAGNRTGVPVFDRTRSHLRQWPQGARRALEGQQAREG